MTTAVSFEGIRYVRSNLYNTTALTPLRETHHKGGILGVVLGVAAAIFVPMLAPTIAGTLFGAGTALGTAFPMLAGAAAGSASALGSALVGSALGAGASALTGGNPLTGALMGGVTSGAGALFSGAPLFGSATETAGLTGAQLSAASAPTAFGVPGAASQAAGAPISSSLANTLSGVNGSVVAGTAGSFGGTNPATAAAPSTNAPATNASAPSSISQTLSNATGNLVSADTVGKLGQSALAAGVQAVPSLLAADEAAAAASAQADLAKAQADVYKQQLSIAEDLKKSALAVDPQYLGQRAQSGVFKNLAAQQRELAGAEAVRGGESQAAFDAAELRRGQIYGTEAAITAGENARLAGLSTQNQMLRGASAAYPNPPSGYANYLERAAGNAAEGYGNIAGAFAYPFLTDYMRKFYSSQKNPNAIG